MKDHKLYLPITYYDDPKQTTLKNKQWDNKN